MFTSAQVRVDSLNITMYGLFHAVHLAQGGQPYAALMGRTFLRLCKMTYDGKTGAVTLSA